MKRNKMYFFNAFTKKMQFFNQFSVVELYVAPNRLHNTI